MYKALDVNKTIYEVNTLLRKLMVLAGVYISILINKQATKFQRTNIIKFRYKFPLQAKNAEQLHHQTIPQTMLTCQQNIFIKNIVLNDQSLK